MSDTAWLTRALELADRRRGFCAPNPAVGCVLVRDGRVVAEGAHEAAGKPHAEAVALALAGEAARGATAYVSLEPCAHFGRTPPCADALVAAGVREVVFGLVDPDPRVAGKGAARLREAGIPCRQVTSGAIDSFYESYSRWKRTGRPFVTAKLALSLDGKIAAVAGRPEPISGPEAGRLTMEERRRADAILTTATTVISDDPRLTSRLEEGVVGKPVFVLDRKLLVRTGVRLFESGAPVTLLHGKQALETSRRALEDRGARCVTIPESESGLDLEAAIAYVGETGAHDLWVEAGGRCVQAMLAAKLVQRLLIYVAPRWIGGEGLPAFSDGFEPFAGAASVTWRPLGRDVSCEARW